MSFVALLVLCQNDVLECGESNVAAFVDLTVEEARHLKTAKDVSCGCHYRVFREEAIAIEEIGLHQNHAFIIDADREDGVGKGQAGNRVACFRNHPARAKNCVAQTGIAVRLCCVDAGKGRSTKMANGRRKGREQRNAIDVWTSFLMAYAAPK
jgi:hypothetical protein